MPNFRLNHPNIASLVNKRLGNPHDTYHARSNLFFRNDLSQSMNIGNQNNNFEMNHLKLYHLYFLWDVSLNIIWNTHQPGTFWRRKKVFISFIHPSIFSIRVSSKKSIKTHSPLLFRIRRTIWTYKNVFAAGTFRDYIFTMLIWFNLVKLVWTL